MSNFRPWSNNVLKCVWEPLSPVDFIGAAQMLEIMHVFTRTVGLGASGLRSAVENWDDPALEANIAACEARGCK